MSHAEEAVQSGKPAKTINQLVIEGSAELIAARSIMELNTWLAHFGVDYCVPADDTRLNEAAANLATANHAHQKLVDDDALARDHFAKLETMLAQRGDLDPNDERDAIKRAMDYARTAMEQLDAGAAAAVARCTDELSRAQHGILVEIMAGHIDRAERALIDAVEGMRTVGRVGAKHLGPDADVAYIPNQRLVALLAG
ncbi:hypothetical protein EVC45_42025 [Paraburkholderia sp. UYCP14C]|uniref:hypothetical protein n=1 Tax=Paraburkholderia sp. UYCP14C TaxID=2511130 RepID=UPI001020E719|nr:hypothetical protein [Paraburkholderia sp. UYCP14C]RZF23848.1 hypothetical protein EVC45_42025 [Paraburkholderia sp. UYCP14C]